MGSLLSFLRQTNSAVGCGGFARRRGRFRPGGNHFSPGGTRPLRTRAPTLRRVANTTSRWRRDTSTWSDATPRHTVARLVLEVRCRRPDSFPLSPPPCTRACISSPRGGWVKERESVCIYVQTLLSGPLRPFLCSPAHSSSLASFTREASSIGRFFRFHRLLSFHLPCAAPGAMW